MRHRRGVGIKLRLVSDADRQHLAPRHRSAASAEIREGAVWPRSVTVIGTPSHSERPLALVTGITGFVAPFVAARLIDGGWRVRATVRSLASATHALAAVSSLSAGAPDQIEFVSVDLQSDAGWIEAIGGVEAVQHVASPVPLVQPREDSALLEAARGGTLRVLRAAAASGTVRQVVITSSASAIDAGHATGSDTQPWTEQSWSDSASPGITAYARSKTLAERAAWEFMTSAQPAFTLTTINPSLILGPTVSQSVGTSVEIVRRLLAGAVPASPRLGWECVDVRDIAALHVKAFTTPAAAGKRFLASAGFLWVHEMAAILRQELGAQASKVPTRRLPDVLFRLLGLFDQSIREQVPNLGRRFSYSTANASHLLDWRARPLRETLVDTARTLLARGLV